MMSAEERSIRNGGNGDKPSGLVDVQTGAPVYTVKCSNLRKHGPHIWRVLATGEGRICPGEERDGLV